MRRCDEEQTSTAGVGCGPLRGDTNESGGSTNQNEKHT
jgi:hypothetical protein